MKLSYLSLAFILVAGLSLLLGLLTTIFSLPLFLFGVTPRGYLSLTSTALMFAIALMLWEFRSQSMPK